MVDYDVIQSIPRDSIPAIHDPTFGDEYVGRPSDRVFVVEAEDGPVRGYPNRILWYHEIVNDTVDGTPIVLSWCEICGSATAYDRRVGGQTLTFSQRGKLANDNMVMYDHETKSEWKQSRGLATAGELEGSELTPLPITMVTGEQFQEAYPGGVVLQPPGGVSKKGGEGSAPAEIDYSQDAWDIGYLDSELFGRYAVYDLISDGTPTHYDEADEEWVEVSEDSTYVTPREWTRDDLDPKDVVVGLEFEREVLGVPEPAVADSDGVVEVTVGGRNVVVLSTDVSSEYPFPQAYANPGFEFEPTNQENVYRADGALWNALTGQSNDARELERVPQRRLFAYTWQDDYGPESFYRPEREPAANSK